MAGEASKNDLEHTYKTMDKHMGPDWEANMIQLSRRIMGKPGASMLEQMGIRKGRTEPVDLFDNACGSGLLVSEAQRILGREVLEKSTMFCADNSQLFVDLVKRRIESEGWVRTGAEVLDATNTGLPDASFSHVGINFAMHIIPDGDAVLKDSLRILKPGGHLGLTTMHADNQGWAPDFRTAFASLPFDAPLPDPLPMQMHGNGRWTDPEWIAGRLEEAGLQDVVVTTQPGTVQVESAAAFVDGYGSMLPWITGRYWSEETRAAHGLDEVKELMKAHLEEKYKGKGWTLDWMFIVATGRRE